MKTSTSLLAAAMLLAVVASFVSCATQNKLKQIRDTAQTVTLKLPLETDIDIPDPEAPVRDSLVVTDEDGTELIIMRAVRDDESGEMVATEELSAAILVARFRNVAERHGVVDLEFQIIVGDSLQDNRWQLRFDPVLSVLGSETVLDPIYITGSEFRRSQLRGYQLYDRFLQSIARDSALFVDRAQLECFVQRNLPRVYAFRSDTSFVSDEAFESAFGVNQDIALQHYTRQMLVQANASRVARKDAKRSRYLRNPIGESGIRLDTVVHSGGDFIYNYVQTIPARKGLRKAEIVLQGEIFDTRGKLYDIPRSAPLTFYISSLSSFLDTTTRYRTVVVERRVESNASCNIDFASGKSDYDESRSGNREQMSRIRGIIAELLDNSTLDIDSITVTASCSPEGSLKSNAALAAARSKSVMACVSSYVAGYTDSLRRESGVYIGEDGAESLLQIPEIRFSARSIAEDWPRLDRAVKEDAFLTDSEKAFYASLPTADPDRREKLLRTDAAMYRHLREDIYPGLRCVRFDFCLHRRGMVKDTVHTEVVDTAYMRGVQALEDRDYALAASILGPYADFNAAVAWMSMDYNSTARAILENLPSSAKVNYMLSVLCSRDGDDRSAVEYYLRACAQNPAYRHRGNLDPEIAAMIKRYSLSGEED